MEDWEALDWNEEQWGTDLEVGHDPKMTECMCETCMAIRMIQGRPKPPPIPKLDDQPIGNAGMLRGIWKRDLLYAKEEIIARQLEDFMNEFPEVDIRKIRIRPDKEHIGRLVVTIKMKERK